MERIADAKMKFDTGGPALFRLSRIHDHEQEIAFKKVYPTMEASENTARS